MKFSLFKHSLIINLVCACSCFAMEKKETPRSASTAQHVPEVYPPLDEGILKEHKTRAEKKASSQIEDTEIVWETENGPKTTVELPEIEDIFIKTKDGGMFGITPNLFDAFDKEYNPIFVAQQANSAEAVITVPYAKQQMAQVIALAKAFNQGEAALVEQLKKYQLADLFALAQFVDGFGMSKKFNELFYKAFITVLATEQGLAYVANTVVSETQKGEKQHMPVLRMHIPESLFYHYLPMQHIETHSGHDARISSVAWNPTGTMLASGSLDRTIKIWNTTTLNNIHTLLGHNNTINSIAWNPAGTMLASGALNNIKIWDTAIFNNTHTLWSFHNSVKSVAWNPAGTMLAAGYDDGTIKIWNTTTSNLIHTLQGHNSLVNSIAWHPLGTMLASGSWDHTIRIWDTATFNTMHVLADDTYGIMAVAWNPQGTMLAAGCSDNQTRIWKRTNIGFDYVTLLEGNFEWQLGNYVTSVAWHPTGTMLVAGFSGGSIKIWDVTTFKPMYSMGVRGFFSSQGFNLQQVVAWDPTGTMLASCSSPDGQIISISQFNTYELKNLSDNQRLLLMLFSQSKIITNKMVKQALETYPAFWQAKLLKEYDDKASYTGRLRNFLFGRKKVG